MTTEFDQRFNTAQAGGMNAAFVGGVGGEAIMGRRPPSREGLEEEGSLFRFGPGAAVGRSQIIEEYMGLSVEEQERLAQALFTEGLMGALGITAIDEIYDPYNVAIALGKAMTQSEIAFEMGTARGAEMLPTLEERFSGFTDEAFNEAAGDLMEKYAVSYLDRATLNNLYTTAYRTEVGRTPSEGQLQSFVAGIHAAQDAGQTISLTNVSAQARESARGLNPERVQVMRENKAAQSIMRALEKL
jgi:hypothetical protein